MGATHSRHQVHVGQPRAPQAGTELDRSSQARALLNHITIYEGQKTRTSPLRNSSRERWPRCGRTPLVTGVSCAGVILNQVVDQVRGLFRLRSPRRTHPSFRDLHGTKYGSGRRYVPRSQQI